LAALNRALARLEEGLIAVLLAGMTLMTFSQVVARYGFDAGWVWSLEATTCMFGALLMVGISYAMRLHAHMNVDAFVNTLPGPLKRAATLLAIALCFAYLGLMIWGALELVNHLRELGTNARDLPVKRWIIMSMVPAGFVLLSVRLMQVAAEVIRGDRDTLGPHGHAKDSPASALRASAGSSAEASAGSGPEPAADE
jgi:C4-dicarboxylate transporter DctQ subunit